MFLKEPHTSVSVSVDGTQCVNTSFVDHINSLEVIRRLNDVGKGKKHIAWGFVKVNEAAKHFSRNGNCSNGLKTFSYTRGGRLKGGGGSKGRGRRWGLSWQQQSCPGNSSVPMATHKVPGRRTWELG